MADTLAFLYAKAVAQPERYEFLNRERASALQASMVFNGGGQPALRDQYELARQRLLAGQTQEAIADLERLRRTVGLTIDAKAPENKAFFDLLGIAYLRLGEQENCNLTPNASQCILGQLHHTQEEGARKAIAVYEQLLGAFPDDRGSQWLLNVAYMAVGRYPDGVPKRFLIPNLTLKRDKSFPLFWNIAPNVGASVTGLAGGLCVEDFNRDGLLDLFITEWGLNDPVHLLLADGHGGYVDKTAQTGLKGIVGGPNCTHADYDNDGNEDIFIMRGGWLGTAAWADFNLDGYLDLFVGNESGVGLGWGSHPSELFLNNRDGTFTEVSHKVGIDLDAFVKGVAWGDVNNDGLPDLFVSVMNGPNRLYMNRGGKSIDTWRFEEVGAKAGVQLPLMSFPAWFFDYDNDGWEDLLVLSYDNRAPLNEAVAREYLGLPPVPFAAGGAPFEHSHLTTTSTTARSRMSRKPSAWPTRRSSPWGATSATSTTTAGWISTSAPGTRISGRNWITLELQGRIANRSAIGARVKVVAAEANGTTRTIWRTVGTGGSFGAGPLQLHVGLGTAVSLPMVEVTWPDSLRSKSSYTNLQVRQTYSLVQGQAARLLDRPPVPFRHGAAAMDKTPHR